MLAVHVHLLISAGTTGSLFILTAVRLTWSIEASI
jgi:hypothetical protein